MATKSYALSKTKVREMITEQFGSDNETQVKLGDVIALFEGASTGGNAGTTLVYNEAGDIVAKRCSYFGVFMAISEFGKRGDSYAYQSKLGESQTRKVRSDALKAKELADDNLADEVITVDEWRSKLKEIEAMKEAKVAITDIEDAPEYFESAEDAKEALA